MPKAPSKDQPLVVTCNINDVSPQLRAQIRLNTLKEKRELKAEVLQLRAQLAQNEAQKAKDEAELAKALAKLAHDRAQFAQDCHQFFQDRFQFAQARVQFAQAQAQAQLAQAQAGGGAGACKKDPVLKTDDYSCIEVEMEEGEPSALEQPPPSHLDSPGSDMPPTLPASQMGSPEIDHEPTVLLSP